MMFERFASVRFFDVRVGTVARYAKDLIVIFRLAASESRLGTLEFAAQRPHVGIRALKLSLLERGSKVRDGVIVLFVMEPDPCARA
jgi:hypothetical protein